MARAIPPPPTERGSAIRVPVRDSSAGAESRISPTRKLRGQRTEAGPCAAPSDSSAASQRPPIPVQEAVSKQERQKRHAAEKHAKRHLVIAECQACRLPGAPPGLFRRNGRRNARRSAARLNPAKALHPDRENRTQSKQRTRQRCRKNG